jgi:hypothetical protein
VNATTAPRADGASIAARWVFAAMVLACFAAFFVTQRLKHTPTLVQRVQIGYSSFSALGHHKLDPIAFLTDHDDVITVTIVDSSDRYVATTTDSATGRPARDIAVERYKRIRVVWDGRTSSGTLARPGVYQVSVYFAREHRAIVPQRTITVVSVP